MNTRRIDHILTWFDTMPVFETLDNIPELPVVSEEIYKGRIVPNLIRCGAIPKSKLKAGSEYIGTCRNSERAVWNGEKFEYDRTKFGHTYKEFINHFEDDDGYDLFVPLFEV